MPTPMVVYEQVSDMKSFSKNGKRFIKFKVNELTYTLSDVITVTMPSAYSFGPFSYTIKPYNDDRYVIQYNMSDIHNLAFVLDPEQNDQFQFFLIKFGETIKSGETKSSELRL